MSISASPFGLIFLNNENIRPTPNFHPQQDVFIIRFFKIY